MSLQSGFSPGYDYRLAMDMYVYSGGLSRDCNHGPEVMVDSVVDSSASVTTGILTMSWSLSSAERSPCKYSRSISTASCDSST